MILQQHNSRIANHTYSERSKSSVQERSDDISVGDLVYLFSDKSKLKARDRYLVVEVNGIL